jgi:ribosomal protein S12 methylthiotransferase
MALQRKISKKRNRARIGNELDVLVEGTSEDNELVFCGRHAGQAPEIDGTVYLSGGPVLPGQMRRVKIVGGSDYDLHGEVCDALESDGEAREPTASALVHRPSDGRRVSLRVVG